MVYKAIGLMSGSSRGLDIAYVEFQETGGKWNYTLIQVDSISYSREWTDQLRNATLLGALEYYLLHTAYGHYLGEQVNQFIDRYELHHKVHLVCSHGHTTFHLPAKRMTAQLGDGAAIAAVTGLPVVSDLRAMDIAFGGRGTPVVPIGEKLLFPDYDLLLNLGGNASITAKLPNGYMAFDVCAANSVLDLLANDAGYDDNGALAAMGKTNEKLLAALDMLPYYGDAYPKWLATGFASEAVYPLVKAHALSTPDALQTYTAHICQQIAASLSSLLQAIPGSETGERRLLVTGSGALNTFLVGMLQQSLAGLNISLVVPDRKLVDFKEALIIALMGVLRWREEYNVLSSVTGATRNSIGGALWLGGEA